MKDSNKKNWRHSIQAKLFLSIAAVLIASTLFLTITGVQFIRHSTTEALEQSMRQTSTIAADRVADYLGLKVSLVQSIASRVGALYEPYIVQPYAETNISFLEEQMSGMAAAYGFDILFVVDNGGYARTSRHSHLAANAPDYYTAIAEDGKSSFLSDVAVDSGALGGNVINISVPIQTPQGTSIGILVAKLDAFLISELVAGINIGENGSTFVMDGSGNCIAHKDPEMCFGGPAYTEYRNNPAYSTLNQLWDDMRDNTDGFTSYTYNGARLAAYDTINGTNNWTLAVTADESEFMEGANRSTRISTGIAIGFMLLAFLVCLAIIRPIVRRVSAVTSRLERLSKGDLADDVAPDKTLDEVGRLTTATDLLVKDLNRMIRTINDALSDMAEGRIRSSLDGEFNGDFVQLKQAVEKNLSKLGALVKQISRTSEEVSRGSVQIAAGATDLAQGASEQASSIEELYSTVSELTARAKEISNPSVHYLDESENEPTDEAEAARIEAAPTLVNKLNAAMDIIRQRLTEIRKISSAINSISSETGMLALNASVEATHAGEYGKGFAVIASDVRDLSEKCRQESQNADTQVDNILRAMNRSDQVLSFTIDAVAEISQALSLVENALSQISAVIESTAATAEESAAGSQELSAQAEVLRDLASTFTYETRE